LPNWLRELAATVGIFDRSAIEPGYALLRRRGCRSARDRCSSGSAALQQLETKLAHERAPACRFVLDPLRSYVEAAMRIARLVGEKKSYA
jgi:hypothetical protein